MNLTTKIGMLVALALAVSLLVQVLYLFPELRSREFGLQRVQNEAAAHNIASEIKDFQDRIYYRLDMLATMPAIKSMDAKMQEPVLALSIRASQESETVSIGVANTDGVITSFESCNPVVISSKLPAIGMDISDYDYFASCMFLGDTYYSDPFKDRLSGLTMSAIAMPIRADDGTVSGIIFAEIPVKTMTGMLEKHRLDEFESAYLVDRRGFVIAYWAKDMIKLPGEPLSLDYSDYTVVQDLTAGRSGVREYEYDGESYLASYMVVGASGWGIVFQEPLSHVMAKSNVVPNFLLGTSVAVFIAAVLIALLSARQITNPIRKLAEYAGRVERGDYTAELEVKGRDEIAGVSSAIKTMVQQMLAMQEKEVTAIVNSMSDGLIVLNQNHQITRLNPCMEQMLGVKASEVFNKGISELETDSRLSSLARLARAESPEDEVILTEPHDRVLRVHSSRLMSEEGRDLGEVKVVFDVTRERELDQMKSDFIASTSHELRTPLHSIRGFVKLMLDGKVTDSETQREFLGIIDEQGQHLSNLVNSILDIAAMESGEMVFEMQPISIKDVIDNAMAKLQRIADDNDIDIEASLPVTLPIVQGDAERLGQVLTNLVHNAIKFSQKGGRVLIAARADNNSVLVQVIDQGIGIPADAIPLLFQKFSQVHNSVARASGGTGLGLYIVKQIIEAHGGQIWVDSKPGKGSIFSFMMPLNDGYKDQHN